MESGEWASFVLTLQGAWKRSKGRVTQGFFLPISSAYWLYRAEEAGTAGSGYGEAEPSVSQIAG